MRYVEMIRKKIGHDPLIICGACVLVYKDSKILLQKRRDNNMYSLHGGAIELNEDIEDAAKRELFE